MIPIAQLLRNNSLQKPSLKKSKSANEVKITTIEEQIASLEKEIDLDNHAEDDNSDSTEQKVIETDAQESLIVEKDNSGNVIRLISKASLDRIEPLPKKFLPEPFPSVRKRNKNGDKDHTLKSQSIQKRNKKQISTIESGNEVTVSNASRASGLESTVREMLRYYEPVSGDRKPFYCRVCRFQGESLDTFNIHRESEAHKIASKIEEKMSSCKLCRKKFTSPAQLKEHLQAKPHKDRLQILRSRQFTNSKLS